MSETQKNSIIAEAKKRGIKIHVYKAGVINHEVNESTREEIGQ